MHKFNVVILLLTFTLGILNDNLGFISPVKAQEYSSSPISHKDPDLILSQIKEYNRQERRVKRYPRVRDLQDVTPNDWAYQALRKLINNYRCIAGYDDKTFKGDRNINRYEFAAALSACVQRMEMSNRERLQANQEDIAQIERLQKEFAEELTQINNEVDNLDQRITFLEENNFSTTTILQGEVDFRVASAFGDKKAVPSGETPSEDLDSQVTFGNRVRLNLETSFTGRDLLRVRIEAGNLNGYGLFATGTQMTSLGGSTNTNQNVRLGQIFYRFPLGDKGNAYIAGARQSSSAFIPTLNRASTISLFGFNNPLYDLGFGAGGGVYYQFTDLIGAGITYYSGSPNNPEPSRGFFNGDYSALGQVTFTPSDKLGFSFTYAHFFTPRPRLTINLTGFTGSLYAQLPFGLNTATSSDNFNFTVSYQISDRLELGGWIGYINAVAESSPSDSGLNGNKGANAEIWTWALTASYNDLGKLGSKLSFILGMPPKLTHNDVSDRSDRNTSFHLELSYNYPITDNISITPGVLAITSPEHNSKNGAIFVSVLTTTFRF